MWVKPSAILKSYVAEAFGTLFLLTTIVGSHSMSERLLPGNKILDILASGGTTGLVLACLIYLFRFTSGAHFNPAISLVEAGSKRLLISRAFVYFLMQFTGALLGVCLAHAMFGQTLWQISRHAHSGGHQGLSEAVATFGLVLISLRLGRRAPDALPWLVGGYIASAHWFTASTCFANPAVTLARMFTDTTAGIRPEDVPGFLIAQSIGASLAFLFAHWLE